MIGITIPLKHELNQILPLLKSYRSEKIHGYGIYRTTINRNDLVIIQTGHGKILSAAGTQLIISKFDCKFIFHLGTAGAIDQGLNIGDIIAAETVTEHDYLLKFGNSQKKPVYHCDTKLTDSLTKYLQTRNQKVFRGKIISGNEDILDNTRRKELSQLYNALSVDWESCGCAAVCNKSKIPVAIIRTISDFSTEKTVSEYQKNSAHVMKNLSKILIEYIDSEI